MATARKLASGSWRCQVYSHTEEIIQPDGSVKQKRFYKSFTCDVPGPKGKRMAERMAAEWASEKEHKKNILNCTIGEAIEMYINSKDGILSPSTIAGYKRMQKNGFKHIMNTYLTSVDKEYLQEAVNREAKRKSLKRPTETISPKTVKNEYGLISAALNAFCQGIDTNVKLPTVPVLIKDLQTPDAIFAVFEGTDIELPVLLAMWLSFSMSEIRGLTKSKSISKDGNYISVTETVVKVDNDDVRKKEAKNNTRIRRHRIPEYIKGLIEKVPGDVLVPYSYNILYKRFQYLLEESDMPHMTFHDLRHINASVMAQLRVPDKYAQERGGWKTDQIMKKVYTHTFSDERIAVDNVMDNFFENIVQNLSNCMNCLDKPSHE